MRSRRDVLTFFGIAVAVIVVAVVFGYIAMTDLTQKFEEAKNPALIGMPTDWQLNFHWPNSPFQHDLYDLHNLMLGIDIAIFSVVAILIFYSIWRFRESRNPVPSRTAKNTPLEITWTVVPVLILVIIAIPSFKLLYGYTHMPKTATVLKVTGHQWYWEYQYPGYKNIDIQSLILSDDELKGAQKRDRLLLVDNYAVLPVDTDVLIKITSGDVIHSFFVSSLGLQKYAVPGRTNEIWAHVGREGTFYGECNQICGVNHAFMPIGIKVVSKEAFAKWLENENKKQPSAMLRQKTPQKKRIAAIESHGAGDEP